MSRHLAIVIHSNNIGITTCCSRAGYLNHGYEFYCSCGNNQWVYLLFPLYIISILFGIIIVSRHSICFSHFIGNKKPIAILAMLMLYS